MREQIRHVLNDVEVERYRQIGKGFDEFKDDNNNSDDWRDFITCYAWRGWLSLRCSWNETTLRKTDSLNKARHQFIKVAALAVAAVESIDRKLEAHHGKEHVTKPDHHPV